MLKGECSPLGLRQTGCCHPKAQRGQQGEWLLGVWTRPPWEEQQPLIKRQNWFEAKLQGESQTFFSSLLPLTEASWRSRRQNLCYSHTVSLPGQWAGWKRLGEQKEDMQAQVEVLPAGNCCPHSHITTVGGDNWRQMRWGEWVVSIWADRSHYLERSSNPYASADKK